MGCKQQVLAYLIEIVGCKTVGTFVLQRQKALYLEILNEEVIRASGW